MQYASCCSGGSGLGTGSLPEDLVPHLQRILGGWLKQCGPELERALDLEETNIERILTMKQQFLALCGSVVLSVLIGVCNFISSWAVKRWL